MKLIYLTCLLLLPFGFALGQAAPIHYHSDFEHQAFDELDPFKILFSSDPNVDLSKYNSYRADFNHLVAKLKSYQQRHTKLQTIEKAFFYTHKKKLLRYNKYVTLGELFENGKYDCLTGTALYALLLKHLNISYSIYEFDFHVLILSGINGDTVLIESTDPRYGFETKDKYIKERLSRFDAQTQANKKTSSSTSIQYGKLIANQVSLTELAGLQYYNLAIKAYNVADYNLAQQMLNKADFLYPSRRMQSISAILQKTIASND